VKVWQTLLWILWRVPTLWACAVAVACATRPKVGVGMTGAMTSRMDPLQISWIRQETACLPQGRRNIIQWPYSVWRRKYVLITRPGLTTGGLVIGVKWKEWMVGPKQDDHKNTLVCTTTDGCILGAVWSLNNSKNLMFLGGNI
jgi:hypothetical protein